MTEAEMLVRFSDPAILKQAHDIMARLSQDHSFAGLWKRLDQAERDRDRMMSALQLVRDEIGKGAIAVKPKHKTIINRALSRVQPVRAMGGSDD